MQTITYLNRRTGEHITEQPPGESYLRFLYHHPLGQLPLELLVKRKLLSTLYGKLMDRPRSTRQIRPFVEEYQIDMQESVKSIDEFTSFNDFFYRKLRPDARPIDQGLVSPADGKLLAFENVSEVDHFFVKGEQFTLKAFLQNNNLAEKYRGGSLLIVRLAPPDYHRFHFPYAGHISKAQLIDGYYYSVSPYSLLRDFTKVFCQNKRKYATLSTPDKGDITLVAVGATMVGSIIETYDFNSKVEKGDEMGYFAFGGSSIAMLLEKDRVQIDADLLENTRNGMETAVRMGERIGK